MEEAADQDHGFECAVHAFLPPALVSLAPFSSPSSRRLSTGGFAQSSCPIPVPPKRMARVSLQGRLLNAEEASSVRAVGGGLSRDEAVAWELFSPVQRFLIVAVIGVAAAESKKNRLIWRLTKSVELRDQVLSSMQQKLDGLCEQVNNARDHSSGRGEMAFTKNVESSCNDAFGSDQITFVDCGCWFCDQHRVLYNGLAGSSVREASSGEDMLQYKLGFSNEVEPEERRMSDLSDWASSVTSSGDIQMNTSVIEQDSYNLKRDSEEKDATIKELTTLLHSSDVAGSKVVHFTRLRRSSFPLSDSNSNSNSERRPHMAENLLYDMDSSTSPSSSDSDCSPSNQSHAPVAKVEEIPVKNSYSSSTRNQMSAPAKPPGSFVRLTDWSSKSRSISPLKEISTNWKSDSIPSLRQKQAVVGDSSRKSRRRHLTGSKDATPQKRWLY